MGGRRKHRRIRWLLAAAALVGLTLLPPSELHRTQLDRIKDAGRLRVLTINGPTTYYEGSHGFVGFEYDLARRFARSLGVNLEMEVEPVFTEVFARLIRGDADFVAAGLTVTEQRKDHVRFSPPYQQIRQQVVYRRGNLRPRTVADLVDRDIAVLAGTSFVERLEELQRDYPQLTWQEIPDMSIDEMLIEVWEGLQDVTIADSHIVAVVRQFYPEIHVAFSISPPQDLAWAFAPDADDSLFDAASEFIEALRQSGDLQRLIERYYGPADRANYLNVATFQRRVTQILPEIRALFEEAGRDSGLDWRLLAAQAYQESMWDPEAVSPTGVRGIMMLTLDTAEQLGVSERSDPRASVLGGARYLRQIFDRLPEDISDPDRMWFALAAYNVGMGHLEDARVITEKQGGDPDKWADVRERLPLLAQPKWHEQTKHGYARGYEPAQYVSRIRTFYDILVKQDMQQDTGAGTNALDLDAPAL
jgi:membrane-bound lytic murein transglycosylase F